VAWKAFYLFIVLSATSANELAPQKPLYVPTEAEPRSMWASGVALLQASRLRLCAAIALCERQRRSSETASA
jgi:hypothetical protein